MNTVNEWLSKRERDPVVKLMLEEMKLEQALLELRDKACLTQREVARLSGIKQPRISRIERGYIKNMELRTLLRLVHALNGKLTITIKKERK